MKSDPVKGLESIVGKAKAKRLVTDLRRRVADLVAEDRGAIEAVRSAYELEEIRDNIWDMYVGESVTSQSDDERIEQVGRAVLRVLFADVLKELGIAEEAPGRHMFRRQMLSALRDVKGFEKLPDKHVPTAVQVAKITDWCFTLGETYLDLALTLIGLTEMEIDGEQEREKGLGVAIAGKLAATALRELTLHEVKPNVLEAALKNKAFGGIESLCIFYSKVDAKLVDAAFAKWPRLAELALAGRKLDKATIATIVKRGVALKRLYLAAGAVTTGELATVLRADWPALTNLGLPDSKLTAADVALIVRHASKLDTLVVSDNPFGDKGVEALLAASFPKLRHLELDGCGLESAKVAKLAPMPALEKIDLTENAVTWPLVEHLISGGRVAELRLGGAKVGDAVVIALAKSPHLKALRILELNDADVGPKGLQALIDSKALPALVDLELIGNQRLDDAIVVKLAKSKLVQRLERLRIFNGGFGEKAEKALEPLEDKGVLL